MIAFLFYFFQLLRNSELGVTFPLEKAPTNEQLQHVRSQLQNGKDVIFTYGYFGASLPRLKPTGSFIQKVCEAILYCVFAAQVRSSHDFRIVLLLLIIIFSKPLVCLFVSLLQFHDTAPPWSSVSTYEIATQGVHSRCGVCRTKIPLDTLCVKVRCLYTLPQKSKPRVIPVSYCLTPRCLRVVRDAQASNRKVIAPKFRRILAVSRKVSFVILKQEKLPSLLFSTSSF